jgi:hypothetical protein
MLSLLQALPALILGILQYENRVQGQVEHSDDIFLMGVLLTAAFGCYRTLLV